MNLIKPFNYFQWCTERADGNVFNLPRLEPQLPMENRKKQQQRKAEEGRKRRNKKRPKTLLSRSRWIEKLENSETVHIVRAPSSRVFFYFVSNRFKLNFN